ncbi:MAG TPA: DUF4388 domain-containing protein [Mycobacteriales bacterium]|nr:DUF4388 domain-containing protein [Mycobacteriales bacterium]
MLKGDLGTTPLAEVLTSLAETEATGCLHVDPGDGGDEALLYVKAGHVYSVHVPGRRPQLGARLVSSGALPPEALEEALEAQQTELHGWRLGELLVHLGYVDQSVVSAFVIEQLREATFDLSRWATGTWKFRKNEKTREDVGGRCSVADLLGEVARRSAEWRQMGETIQGPQAIPVLSSLGMSAAEIGLDQDQWALLCKVDGERDISQLARDCGFTTFEAGQVVFSLVDAGLLEVETAMGEYDHLADDEDAPDDDAEPMSTADALSSAIAMLGGTRGAPAAAPAAPPQPASDPAPTREEWSDLLGDDTSSEDESELGRLFSFGGSSEPDTSTSADDDPLSKVSEALSALLDSGLEPAEPPAVTSLAALRLAAEPPPMDPEALAVLERTRAAAAEELARAHAEAEQDRFAEDEQNYGAIEALVASLREQAAPEPVVPAGPSPEEIAAEEEAKRAAVAAAVAAARAEILASKEAERLAADAAAAQEAARVVEDAERAAEAERAAAEADRRAAAEAERVAAREAERAAAREAELAAMEAAEQASLVAAREAERAAAEAAEQLAAEQAAILAAHEADRLAESAPPPPPPPTPGDVAAALRDVGSTDAAPAGDIADDRDDEEREADDKAHAASQRRQDNDTASLLRELSSLGLDDDFGGGSGGGSAPAPPPRPAAPRPSTAPSKDQGKKRKGLFGR